MWTVFNHRRVAINAASLGRRASMSPRSRMGLNVLITLCLIFGMMAMASVASAQGDREACDQTLRACLDSGTDVNMCEREHLLCRAGWFSPVNPAMVKHEACGELKSICDDVAAADPDGFTANSCQTNYGLCVCSDNARYAPNGVGEGYCLFENLPIPDDAQAYCGELHAFNVLGYHFESDFEEVGCPDGSRHATNSEGLNFCLFENLRVPDGARTTCTYLHSHKSIGYDFPLN